MSADLRDRQKLLGSRQLAVWAVLAAVVLMLPSLRAGFLLDDYFQLAVYERSFPVEPGAEPISNPFGVFPGRVPHTRAMMEAGFFPWWTLPEVKMDFWRPLSSLLGHLDYALFGSWAPGYHLHSLLWLAALVTAAALVLRSVLPAAVAGVALMLFALDESRMLPVTWIANRNALVALTFTFLGLWAHLRWRERGWRGGLPLSLACYAAGMLGGEAAVGGMAYVAAYELTGAPGRWPRRLLALAPAAVMVLGYLAGYRLLGHGTFGSGFYVDPAGEPLAYLSAIGERLPMLLGGLLAGVLADLWMLVAGARTWQIVAGVVAAAGYLALLRWALPTRDATTRRTVRWLVIGSLLALLPVLATYPMDRLLVAATLGTAAGLATILTAIWERLRAARSASDLAGPGTTRLLAATGVLLLAVHAVVAPVVTVAGQLLVTRWSRASVTVVEQLEAAGLATPGPRNVLLAAPDYVVGYYLPTVQRYHGAQPLRSWHTLSIAPYDQVLTRSGPRSLELSVTDGQLLASPLETLFRSTAMPMSPGDAVDVGLFTATILAANAAGPTRVRFDFDRPLEDPSVRFFAWQDGRLQLAEPPAPGQSVPLPKGVGPSGR